jgi:hypothetical protein
MELDTFEQMKTKMREIWYWLDLSDEQLVPLQVPAVAEARYIIFYGTFGGPASKNQGDPIDCLDLSCKLHDATFNQGNASDIALSQSVEYLTQQNMIRSVSAQQYANGIQTKAFSIGCWLWRWVGVWIIILIAILIVICALALLLESM